MEGRWPGVRVEECPAYSSSSCLGRVFQGWNGLGGLLSSDFFNDELTDRMELTQGCDFGTRKALNTCIFFFLANFAC